MEKTDKYAMKLQANLQTLIDRHKLTPTGLSKKTNIPLTTLHGWLNGIEPKSLTQVKKVADFFDVTLDYICFGEREESHELFSKHLEEINAGTFEVVLRRIKK